MGKRASEEDHQATIEDDLNKTKLASQAKTVLEDSDKPPCTMTISFNSIAWTLFIVAFGFRFYAIDFPFAVVFDELHYGRFASLYLKQTFFFDSQPPLGKQLIALSAYLAGATLPGASNITTESFSAIGQNYAPGMPIRSLRFVPALAGSLLVPVVYHLVLELSLGHQAATLAALVVIMENALLTQSKFILLDTILMFFSFFGVLAYLIGRRQQRLSTGWASWMATSGVALACGLCVKYTGVFTLIQVAVIAYLDLYNRLADKAVRAAKLWLEAGYYLFAFILLPILVYCLVFYVHLQVLIKAGPHDNIMTSAFQASLDGGLASIIKGQPREVSHGSQITLRNTHGRTCWLHSHQAVYPIRYADKRGSSHQQQVTCYSFKDVNNWWIVKKPNIDDLITHEPRDAIKDGDIIQLVHGLSGRTLNSHDIAAPVSPYNQEVSCYIDYNISMPAQNLWKVKLLNAKDTGGLWHAIISRIQLVHVNSSQALKLSGQQLPDWGYHQHEVVTDKQVGHQNAVWNVEEHRYTKNADEKELERDLGMAEFMPLSPTSMSFWEKMVELQYKMLVVNPENVQNHMYSTDSPIDWIMLTKGIAYWVSPEGNGQIFLIGNIVVWYAGVLAFAVYSGLLVVYLLRRARHWFDLSDDQWNCYQLLGQIGAFGYLFHLLPYFLTERTLFLHHYLPAVVFKIILLVGILKHSQAWLKRVIIGPGLLWSSLPEMFLVALLSAIGYTFWQFLPLSYGLKDLSVEEITRLKWKRTWQLLVHKHQ